MEDPSTTLREVTLDEAMTIAITFQKRGQLAEAEQVYRKVFDVLTDHVDALH